MVDRGLRRGFDPAVEHEAREVGRRWSVGAGAGGGPARSALAADVHDRPRQRARLRRRDLCVAVGGRGRLARMGAHRRCFGVRRAAVADRPRGVPARDQRLRPGAVEPMLPAALSNDACSLVPGQDRLAVTVEMDVVGSEVSAQCVSPLGDPLRRAADLRAGRSDLRRQGRPLGSPGETPLAAARAAAAALGERRSRARRAAVGLR